ncbi:MAG: hypothetical protein QME96_16530, partial [Myxococcota bacterium]|nr:hypothetical protein [Myxococcota bacterium]
TAPPPRTQALPPVIEKLLRDLMTGRAVALAVAGVLAPLAPLAGCADDECSSQLDCPAGHVCVRGECVRAADADIGAGDGAEVRDDGMDVDEYEDGTGPEESGAPRCGDGVVDPGEECDDGADGDPHDGCRDDCTFSCRVDAECPDDPGICTGEAYCHPLGRYCVDPWDGTDGIVCDEGDVCTGVGICRTGVCRYPDAMNCDDGGNCSTDWCDPFIAECVHNMVPAGTPCDDGVFCTGSDQCWGAAHCSGVLGATCDDGDLCTDDVCDEARRTCDHVPRSYVNLACGESRGGSLRAGADRYREYTCPDGPHSAPTNDEASEVVVAAAGTLTISVDPDRSSAGTRAFILADACDATTCLAHTTGTVGVPVTPGRYWVVVESVSAWAVAVSCP